MKKSLVLAMAMALGVTASAYAANPFSDVPTRYEMAQIVAKAMAKGANVDKLAAEFADELDSLGVRVANLEKKADNVKITGQIRASYKDVSGDKKDNNMRLRSRLFVNGTINDDWTYTGRFHNEQYVNGNDGKGSAGEDDLDFNWAFVSGRVGGVKMDAGRMDFTYADVVDVRGDGVKLAYGDDVKVTGWVFKGNSDIEMLSDDRVYVAGVETSFGAVDTTVRYYRADTEFDNEIVEVALAGEIAKDLTLRGTWFNGTTDDKAETLAGTDVDTNGWLVGLSYGGAKASEPGSWGVYANYSDRPFATYLLPTNLSGYADAPYALLNESSVAGAAKADGYEGYEIGANVTLAKNIVAAVKYFDLEEREGSKDAQTLWSEVVFTF